MRSRVFLRRVQFQRAVADSFAERKFWPDRRASINLPAMLKRLVISGVHLLAWLCENDFLTTEERRERESE